jgi:hypothetical protein
VRSTCLAVGCCLLLMSGAARAEEGAQGTGATLSLGWVRLQGAEECIGPRELAEAVEARLGRPAIVSAAAATLSIEGRAERLEPAGSGFRATLVASAAAGTTERTVTSPASAASCRDLDAEIVAAVASLVDAGSAPPSATDASPLPAPVPAAPEPPDANASAPAAAHEPQGAPAPASEAPSAPAPGAAPAASETAPPPPPDRFRFDVSAAFVIGVGFLPGAPLGAAVSLVFDPTWFWPIELEVAGFFNSSAEPEDERGGQAKFSQLQASLMACAPMVLRTLPTRACFGVQAGGLHAEGEGFAVNHDLWRPVVNGVGRIWVMWSPRGGRFTLRLGGTVTVPIMRDRFVFVDERGKSQVLYEPESVGAYFDAGIILRF